MYMISGIPVVRIAPVVRRVEQKNDAENTKGKGTLSRFQFHSFFLSAEYLA